MKYPQAILVDLDDTLICFDGVSHESWEAACAIKSISIDTLIAEITSYSNWYYSDPDRHRIGRNQLEETRRVIVREAFRRLGLDDTPLANGIADEYSRIRDEKLYLFAGVHETLNSLREQGIGLYLITNGESHLQRRKIERFDLAGYFDAIFIEGECGYGKPDERIFRDVLFKAGVSAADAWIVGDNFDWEVAAPKAMGFTCIWRDKRGEGLTPKILGNSSILPDAIIDDFPEILGLLGEAVRG